MSDSRDEYLRERLAERARREERRREERAPETVREGGLPEQIDAAVRKIVTAIVIAGALIGAGAWASGDEVEAPRYQVTTTPDGRIIRLNTDSGTVLACEGNQCGIVVRRGQDLEDAPPARALPAPAPEARPALPAPAVPKADNGAVPVPAAR